MLYALAGTTWYPKLSALRAIDFRVRRSLACSQASVSTSPRFTNGKQGDVRCTALTEESGNGVA